MGIENIDLETRKAIDAQLLRIAQITCQIGIDTKVADKIEYRRQIKDCLNKIKAMDLEFYKEIVPDSDKK